MSFSKVVLIIVTLIVLDYAQVAAHEDLEVAESKGKKYPRHIQPNVRPTTQRPKAFNRGNGARGRSDSSENGGEEYGPSGHVILSYGGRLGKGSKGQRYGNKYGSDYSVEYVGNLYGYEDGHGYGSGYNNGYNSGYSSAHSGMTNIQHGTSTGDEGSDESHGSKGNMESMGASFVTGGENGTDGPKHTGGSMDDSMGTVKDVGVSEDSKGNTDSVVKTSPMADGTAATDGSMADNASVVGGDTTGKEASKGKDEVMVDSVVTGADAIITTDGMETNGGKTVGIDGTKAMDEMEPLDDGDVTGSVVATGTVGTMDELMALLGDIGGNEGSTDPMKSMDDIMAMIGGTEGIEGIGDITGFTDETSAIDGSTGNTGPIGTMVDSFAIGGDANDDASISGTGSIEEGVSSFSAEDEYSVSLDLVSADEGIDQGASGKSVSANEQIPLFDILSVGESGGTASVTTNSVKVSATDMKGTNEAITIKEDISSGMSEKGKMTEPTEMVIAEALTAMEETGKMAIQIAELVKTDGGIESTSMMDTGSALLPGSEKTVTPSSALEGNANSLRRMGRNRPDNRRPINYRNGDRRTIAVGKVTNPVNRVRPESRAINSKPVENQKYRNLPGNGEKLRSTGAKIGPGSVRNVPMNKPNKQVASSGMAVNNASKFRSIGEFASANRGMKENGPTRSKTAKSPPGNGKNKAMPVQLEMVKKEAVTVDMTVSVASVTEQGKNAASDNPSGSTGGGKKRFLSLGKGRNTSGNSGKLESASGSKKPVENPSGSDEKGKKASGNGDKMGSHGGKGSTRPARPARPAQLMSPPPSKEMLRPNPTLGDTSKPAMASENQEKGESTSEKPVGKGKGGKPSKNSVKEKRQISSSTSGSSSASEKGEKGIGKETDTSESAVKTSSGSGKGEKINGDEGKQNNGFVRNAPLNIVRYLRKGIGRYL